MPRRARLNAVDANQAQNALSVFAFLPGDLKDPAAKRTLLSSVRKASVGSKDIYQMAFERWKRSLPPATRTLKVRTSGRFVTGLGAASVLETGIRLHHVYGTPLIPGSGLKGLAAHYAHLKWGEQDGSFREGGAVHSALFGRQDSKGLIAFHDAWMLPDDLSRPNCGLVDDVMTPHHGKYNTGGGSSPSDMDKPNPVAFLSITGHFLLAVTPLAQDPDSRWTNLTLQLLEAALKDWGAGGKTRAGYGRFHRAPNQA